MKMLSLAKVLVNSVLACLVLSPVVWGLIPCYRNLSIARTEGLIVVRKIRERYVFVAVINASLLMPLREGWHQDGLSPYGCVAVCEVINDPRVLRSAADAPEGPAFRLDYKLPKSYVLATEDSLVRVRPSASAAIDNPPCQVKYLLLFKQKRSSGHYRLFLLICVYAVILLALAVYKSQRFGRVKIFAR
jgi:hypothetical protein